MQTLIDKIKLKVYSILQEDSTGHDWHHIQRVYKTALFIHSKEGGNELIIKLGALLHDISDHKLNGGILNKGGEVSFQLLKEIGFETTLAEQVAELVDNISYKGANVADKIISLEQQIVQDADRLDAIGAIGIARAFMYGGHKNRPMYLPDLVPEFHTTFEAYASAESHTINHFYEKLLLIKNRMHTDTAKKIATKRHVILEDFLENFFNEWNSTDQITK